MAENVGQRSQEDQVTVKKGIKIQKEMIMKGKSKIQEKTKEIRQSFSEAVFRVHAVEVVNWFLNITRSRSPYGVVLRILSLCHLELLVESWMTSIKRFLQI